MSIAGLPDNPFCIGRGGAEALNILNVGIIPFLDADLEPPRITRGFCIDMRYTQGCQKCDAIRAG